MSNRAEIGPRDVCATLSPIVETIEELKTWVHGTDLGYAVIAYSQGNTVTVYKALLRAERSLRSIVDSLPNRERNL